jgi:hypothetical protein
MCLLQHFPDAPHCLKENRVGVLRSAQPLHLRNVDGDCGTGEWRKTVDDILGEFGDFGKLSETAKAAASHATDFDPPISNIWKQQTKSAGRMAAKMWRARYSYGEFSASRVTR